MDHRIWILIKRASADGEPISAILTTDHPASSRGLPIVLHRGQPLGPADIDASATLVLPKEATDAELQATQAAGYRAVREPWPPAGEL